MRVENGLSAGWTALPHAFIDSYMVSAGGEYVKTYIYLLRMAESRELSLSFLAEKLEMTEKAVLRALKYWADEGLLALHCRDGHLEGLRFLPVPEKAAAEPELLPELTDKPAAPGAEEKPSAPAEEAPAAPARTLPEKHSYPAQEIARLKEKEDFDQLLFVVERYLGKTLSSRDTDTLAYLYDGLALPGDALEFLVECCVEEGHKDLRYIEKVALRLHEQGKTTREAMQEDLRRFAGDYPKVRKSFGLTGRQLNDEEKQQVDNWLNMFGMPMELILEACARTMRTIHEPSFAYAEAILLRWKAGGIGSLADLKEKDREPAEKKPRGKKNASGSFNFDQRPTDYDALLSELGV